MGVRVLVEDPFAGTCAERLGLGGIPQQLAIGDERLRGVVHDDQLTARLEPALDALVRIRDDGRGGGRELEGPARGRAGNRGVRTPGYVEVDPCRRDGAREHVERDVPERARIPRVTLEVTPAEREVDLGRGAARLPDERLHPLAPELVAVAVEEDIDVL